MDHNIVPGQKRHMSFPGEQELDYTILALGPNRTVKILDEAGVKHTWAVSSIAVDPIVGHECCPRCGGLTSKLCRHPFHALWESMVAL
jgi:hypothetical protein